MSEDRLFADRPPFGSGTNERFLQYLSSRFYSENAANLRDNAKESINNFLKTIAEIEDEFVSILQAERSPAMELNDRRANNAVAYMEENY